MSTVAGKCLEFHIQLLFQIVGTGIFCGSIATIVDSRNKIPGPMQPLLIGFVVMMIGASYGMNAGGTINPARDLGPRIFTLCIGYGWNVFRLA